jgi:uncharacterized protein YodC (DUF2158 family)
MNTEFKVGDTVKLKSGGDAITVVSLPLEFNPSLVLCMYANSEGIQQKTIPIVALVLWKEGEE